MSTPFIGEIRMFGGNFAPAGWAFCNGSLIPISQNDTLFNLIGTTYGGDGQTTFALPDLRGRVPLHQGQGPGLTGYIQGENGGTETATLTSNQMPAHRHAFVGNGAATGDLPAGKVVASPAASNLFTATAPGAALAPAAMQAAGGNQPHDNMMPYLAVSFIISLFGIFPSQN